MFVKDWRCMIGFHKLVMIRKEKEAPSWPINRGPVERQTYKCQRCPKIVIIRGD